MPPTTTSDTGPLTEHDRGLQLELLENREREVKATGNSKSILSEDQF